MNLLKNYFNPYGVFLSGNIYMNMEFIYMTQS